MSGLNNVAQPSGMQVLFMHAPQCVVRAMQVQRIADALSPVLVAVDCQVALHDPAKAKGGPSGAPTVKRETGPLGCVFSCILG
jgi:hypothetical protein